MFVAEGERWCPMRRLLSLSWHTSCACVSVPLCVPHVCPRFLSLGVGRWALGHASVASVAVSSVVVSSPGPTAIGMASDVDLPFEYMNDDYPDVFKLSQQQFPLQLLGGRILYSRVIH